MELRGQSEKALRDLVGTGETVCTRKAIDPFQRVLAQCIANGKDIAAELVHLGLAVAVTSETDAYAAAEREAASAGVGMWRGAFLRPWEYRQSVTNTPDTRK